MVPWLQLEACYLEALAGSGALRDGDFGGNSPGDDVASLLTASWRETRRAILNYGSICQFNFRQFLFARQARLLLTLNRPIELAERAMKFVQTFGLLLMDKEAKSHLQEKFRQARSPTVSLPVK